MSTDLIYLAGPYSQGNTEENVRRAVGIGTALIKRGFNIIIPHLSHFANLIYPGVSYDRWLDMDLVMVDRCNAVIRLKGNSPGADVEVEQALRDGKIVYYEEGRLECNAPYKANMIDSELVDALERASREENMVCLSLG